MSTTTSGPDGKVASTSEIIQAVTTENSSETKVVLESINAGDGSVLGESADSVADNVDDKPESSGVQVEKNDSCNDFNSSKRFKRGRVR